MFSSSNYFLDTKWFSVIWVDFVFQFASQILIEVDHIQDVQSPYIQIKGVNKDIVTAAGSTLKLDGSYTTKVCFF